MLGTPDQHKQSSRPSTPPHAGADGARESQGAGEARPTVAFGSEQAAEASAPDAHRWEWVRHWEFWVALVVGAFLRLWHLELSTFLVDQRTTLLLARQAILDHALPVAGVSVSVGPYTLPYGVYFLMPFAALGSDPFPAIVSIALWNVLGVGLCYLFALRYFGRPVAAVGTLLFATSGVAVNYSRFIWNPNYLPPLLGLWALVVFAGCVSGRRGWLAPAVGLLLLAFSVHPVSLILVPVTLVALLLAPRWPSRREYLVAAVVGVVMLVPTLLWEIASGGVDLQLWAAYGRQPATISLTVLRTLYGALGAPSAGDFGPQSLYMAYARWYPWINALAALFFAAGYILVTWQVVAPAWRLWTQVPATMSMWQAIRSWVANIWRGVRADTRWRTRTLLWLWVTLPPLAMLRHNSLPTVHYLLAIFPAMFVVAGLPMGWVLERRADWRRIGGRLGRLGRLAAPVAALAPRFAFALTALPVLLATVLVAAQAAQSALYPASLASGRFDAMTSYGYPLAEMQAAERALSTLQRQQGATRVYVSLPAADRYRVGMDGLLVGEHAGRVGFADTCLVLPPADAAPALVVSTSPGGPPASLLPSLPNAQHVTDIPLAGGAGFAVYRVSGLTPMLPDETGLLTPEVYRDAAGNGLRLEAATLANPQLLRLRWQVLRSTPAGQAAEAYHFQAATSGGSPGSAGVPTSVDCQPESWQVGETVFTWVPLGQPVDRLAAGSLPGGITLSVSESTQQLDTPWLGPLHLLSGRLVGQAPEDLRPAVGSTTPGRPTTSTS